MFKVSVVIPVFNAGKYVEKAVYSALNELEVEEVLLIDDASTDDAFRICEKLQNLNEKVKLLQHNDKKNHGAGATRNLGIQNATCNYIAFLDADDHFLSGRFEVDKEIFSADDTLEGVYNAISPLALDEFGSLRMDNIRSRVISLQITMKKFYEAEELFEQLSPIGNGGFFSLNGLTVKKSVFQKIGLMDVNLRLSQDTDICIKLAAICKLKGGKLNEPVALFGVHSSNRSHNENKLSSNRPYLFYNLYNWGRYKSIPRKRIYLLWERFYQHHLIVNKPSRKQQLVLLIKEGVKNPDLIRSSFFLKQFPILHRIF